MGVLSIQPRQRHSLVALKQKRDLIAWVDSHTFGRRLLLVSTAAVRQCAIVGGGDVPPTAGYPAPRRQEGLETGDELRLPLHMYAA
jgi:hypothetical protein